MELAKLSADLKKKLDDAVALYKEQLHQRLIECVTTFDKSIAAYKTKAAELIKSVIGKYSACLSKRATSIAAYKKKLEDDRDAKRTTFYNAMWDVSYN